MLWGPKSLNLWFLSACCYWIPVFAERRKMQNELWLSASFALEALTSHSFIRWYTLHVNMSMDGDIPQQPEKDNFQLLGDTARVDTAEESCSERRPCEDNSCTSLPGLDMLEPGFTVHWLVLELDAPLSGRGSHRLQRAAHKRAWLEEFMQSLSAFVPWALLHHLTPV